MNDLEFEQRAHADPYDASPEFLAAIQERPERQKILDDLLNFDKTLQGTLASVSADGQLKQSLLKLSDIADIADNPPAEVTPVQAANDRVWLRWLPIAACLLLTIGTVIAFFPKPDNELEQAIFSHIYHEIDLLNSTGSISISETNQLMSEVVGAQLQQNSAIAGLEIKKTKKCWVARENAIHMVVKGNAGPVTVMLIPNEPIKKEVIISDERFDGVISPTENGNLVVVGEKEEPIQEVSRLLANNLSW